MKIIPRDSLLVEARQRTAIAKEPLNDLRVSILERGLLHPLVVQRTDQPDQYRLIAGERRLRAIELIAKDNAFFFCDSVAITPGEVPVTEVSDLSTIDQFVAELEENIIRVDLSWQDRTAALAHLHAQRKLANPKQTVTSTSRELVAKNPNITYETIRAEVTQAVVVAKHLSNPAIAKARNANEAYQLVLGAEHAAYKAELIRRKQLRHSAVECEIRRGDARTVMSEMDEGQVDLILTDPPYGIGASAGSYRARTVHHHNYEDSHEYARELLMLIVSEGWRITKPKANLFIFTEVRHFDYLKLISAQMGWTPWPRPVIWQKSTAEGLVPWGKAGFIFTWDCIFYATKGQRGLNRPHLDILTFNRVPRNKRTYAAEKPVDLLKLLIDLTTLPGDLVFDPCAGSGSTLLAAKALSRRSLGVEIDPQIADLATVRITEGDSKADFSILAHLEEPQDGHSGNGSSNPTNRGTQVEPAAERSALGGEEVVG